MVERAISSELTGGAGFTFEDNCVAYYLSNLVAEREAAGLTGIVTKVAVQQGPVGDPLDDIIVHFLSKGENKKLSLQAKTKVTLTQNNGDFKRIVEDSVRTLKSDDFQEGLDRFGFVARNIAQGKWRDLNRIIDWARSSTNSTEFLDRFVGASSSKSIKKLKTCIDAIANFSNDSENWKFYQHFIGLKFDNLNEDEAGHASLVHLLNDQLLEDADDGSKLFDSLLVEARKGAGNAKIWDRYSLLNTLRSKFKFKAKRNFVSDLKIIKSLYNSAISEIKQTIGDFHLDRIELFESAFKKSKKAKFANISGLPGCGKSVVLRKLAERSAEHGPVLLLKFDNFENVKSWQAFASALGITNNLKEILLEIGVVGTPTLFIDGIDRIPPNQTKIVCDILNEIESNSELGNWNVVASSRDQGLEVFRSWVPSSFYKQDGITDIAVTSLNDEEAEELAKKHPFLRGLLFGSDKVKEIARRPFFASILAKHISANSLDNLQPRTESELINSWWQQGGYDCTGAKAVLRQRAIIDLAQNGAPTLGKKIAAKTLKADTIKLLTEFLSDGILEEISSGSRYSFSHDIFFEWSFFQTLVDEEKEWPVTVKNAGQAPLLDRVVSLFSAYIIENDNDWSEYFPNLAENKLRKQWLRAWVLGPCSSPMFQERVKQFEECLRKDDNVLLKKFYVWFQAERTIPSPMILQAPNEGIDKAIVLQAADMMSWPSDYNTWKRVFVWTAKNIADFEIICPLEILSFFTIWQNMLGGYNNDFSKKIVEISQRWLSHLSLSDRGKIKENSIFIRLSSEERLSLRDGLIELLLKASAVYPDPATEFLDQLIQSQRIDKKLYEHIIAFSPTLASSIPDKLSKLTLAYVIDELPIDRRERKFKERQDRLDRVAKIKAKPESERTEKEQSLLIPHFHPIGVDYEYDRLNTDIGFLDNGTYHPNAPLWEPFKSLLEKSPKVGISLIKNLSNHAILAWRQVFEVNPREESTPLPLPVEFPWGKQEFWGGEGNVFSWYLGHMAPKVVACALLEFTRWLHVQLDNGRDVDELIKLAIQGHKCTGALGLACSLAIESKHISRTSLALISSQHIWCADFRRLQQQFPSDQTFMGINLQWGMSSAQKKAMNWLENRKFRKQTLHEHAPYFALANDDNISNDFKEALEKFPANLPFNFQEETEDQAYTDYLEERAVKWSSWGDRENYQAFKNTESNGIYVQYTPPEKPSAQDLNELNEARKKLDEYRVFTWASESFNNAKLGESIDLNTAIKFAQEQYQKGMFKVISFPEIKQSMIVSVAALTTKHSRDKASLDWAWNIVHEAKKIQDHLPIDRYSKPTYHPLIYVLLAFREQMRAEEATLNTFKDIFKLCGHEILEISSAAFICIFQFSEKYPEQVWIALCLASELVIEHGGRNYDDREKANTLNKKRRQKAVSKSIKALSNKHTPKISSIPPAWDLEVPPEGADWRSDLPEHYNPDIFFNYYIAPKYFDYLPVEAITSDPRFRDSFITYVLELNNWTRDRIFPTWRNKGNRNNTYKLKDWPNCISMIISRLSGVLDSNEIIENFIKPLVSSKNDDSLSFLNSIVSSIVCRHVYDAPNVSHETLTILDFCLGRMLQENDFNPEYFRSGEIHGHDLPRLIEAFAFVSVKDAPGAVRFANGEWADYQTVSKLVDKLMSQAGWVVYVMRKYLDLCKKAEENLPVKDFARHISGAMNAKQIIVAKWNDYNLLNDIALLIQKQSEAGYPMAADDANELLKIVDELIDVGNRRAAALIHSETFRDLQPV